MLMMLLALAAAERPNVVLFIADDVSWNDVGVNAGRDPVPGVGARTPNIDRLAAAGRNFTSAYLVASSCSPSRTSILTGRYPHNNGPASELHGARPAFLRTLPQELREAGYHTYLSGKDHMPVEPTADVFDGKDGGKIKGHTGGEALWADAVRDRPRDRPFFFWFAAFDAHRGWDADKQWDEAKYGPRHDPADVRVPPYLVDDAATRQDLASYANEITRFDWHIGEVVSLLEQQGVLGETLLLILADNGRPFPRAKTRLHDSGMKTYFISHWPEGIERPGTPSVSLISTVDIAPTVLSLAGAEVPDSMQGVDFTPVLKDPSATVRRYAFSEHNWHDYAAHGRSVRGDGYLYIRNNRPDEAWQGPADSVRSPSHASLQKAWDEYEAGDRQLPAPQWDGLRTVRPGFELYDLAKDPMQVNDLADYWELRDVRKRLASVLDRWVEETADSVPENPSRDSFDRRTGKPLIKDQSFRGTPPGGDRDAVRVDAPGPR